MTHSVENGLRLRCTAFALDTVCVASDPCLVHGCDDTDDGTTAQGCYCDPERPIPPGTGEQG